MARPCGGEPVGGLPRLRRALLAQQRITEPDRSEAVLLRLVETGGERVEQLGHAALPGAPVRRVDDRVGVADPRRRLACGERVGVACRLLRRADEPALPVEEAEEGAEVARAVGVVVGGDVEERRRRSGERLSRLLGEVEQVDQREVALQVHVHLRLRQGADPRLVDAGAAPGLGQVRRGWVCLGQDGGHQAPSFRGDRPADSNRRPRLLTSRASRCCAARQSRTEEIRDASRGESGEGRRSGPNEP